MKISQAEGIAILIEAFTKLGVIDFCTAPGSRNTPLVLAANKNKKMTTRVFHDERSMAFFALGIARTGRIPLVCTTSGTAVANLYPAVIEAEYDSQPIIILSADRPEIEKNKGANQTIDQQKIFNQNARFFELPENADAIEVIASVRECLEEIERNPGPVQINIPLSKPLEKIAPLPEAFDTLWKEEKEALEFSTSLKSFAEYTTENLRNFDALLIGANDFDLKHIQSAVKEFEGDTFFDIQSGSWTCGTRPLSAEVFGAYNEKYKRVLILGHRFTEHRIWEWLKDIPYVEQWKSRTGIFDPHSVIDQAIQLQKKTNQSSTFLDLKPKNLKRESFEAPSENIKLCYSKLVDILSTYQHAYKNCFLSNSLTIRAFDRFRSRGNFKEGSRIFCNRGASGIDGILATTMGISTEGATISIIGDHSFLYDLPLLPDLKNLDVHATLVIVDNQGGHIFDHLPISKNDALEYFYTADPSVNFQAILEAFGFSVITVKTSRAFDNALRKTQEGTNMLQFIIAKVDPKYDFEDFSSQTQARFL